VTVGVVLGSGDGLAWLLMMVLIAGLVVDDGGGVDRGLGLGVGKGVVEKGGGPRPARGQLLSYL